MSTDNRPNAQDGQPFIIIRTALVMLEKHYYQINVPKVSIDGAHLTKKSKQ